MTTLGNATTPTWGYDSYTGTANQAAQPYTMPVGGGLVSSVSFYGAADGSGHSTVYGCIWNGAGVLLGSGTGQNTTGGAQSGGGQSWHTDTFATPLFIPGGTSIFIGWQRSTAVTFDWSWANDSVAIAYRTAGSTPSNLGTAIGVQAGSIGAYATYTPGGIYVNTGTPASPVWTPAEVLVNTGTPASPVWTPSSGVFINTGTPASPVWTPTG